MGQNFEHECDGSNDSIFTAPLSPMISSEDELHTIPLFDGTSSSGDYLLPSQMILDTSKIDRYDTHLTEDTQIQEQPASSETYDYFLSPLQDRFFGPIKLGEDQLSVIMECDEDEETAPQDDGKD
jgi:hypothetical protein